MQLLIYSHSFGHVLLLLFSQYVRVIQIHYKNSYNFSLYNVQLVKTLSKSYINFFRNHVLS